MSVTALFATAGGPIPPAMMTRASYVLAISLLAAGPAVAQSHKPPAAKTAPAAAGPRQLNKFDDWTAATHQDSGATVCYAFTRAQSSTPALPGRGDVVLTVTERPSGRDAVAMKAGFPYAANAAVTVQVDQTGLEFYTFQSNAFARDGKAAVAAFDKGSRAIARSPGPKEASVTDTFSLKGFSAAYAAIAKACPGK
jgi:invasion protein IalB